MKTATKTFTLRLLLTAGLMQFFPGVTNLLGDDFAPPIWRGMPNSVTAVWNFNLEPTDYSNIGADSWTNYPGGYPLDALYAPPSARVNTNEFIWVGSGAISNKTDSNHSIVLVLPNFIDDLPEKWLAVQMTGSTNLEVMGIAGSQMEGGEYKAYSGFKIMEGGPEPGKRWEEWVINPNPDRESIFLWIPARSVLDQVVVDTISIPEPSTLVLMLVGVVALPGSRRFCRSS
jgi:hypothetical protein